MEKKLLARYLLILVFLCFSLEIQAQNSELLKVKISETDNLDRSLEYVEFSCQLILENPTMKQIQLVAENIKNKEQISCQVSKINFDSSTSTALVKIVFPVEISALDKKEFLIKQVESLSSVSGNLAVQGEEHELIIENDYYRADLTKDPNVEPQSYDSGQIREILIKLGFNQLITNVGDRVHWAPNFDRPETEWYTTIAHWNSPGMYQLENGSYQIRTKRRDLAPNHPEIVLTATYSFYDRLPFFKFYSSMEVKEGVWLQLLRNDEMAMDSMFTHLAFQRPNGAIIDVPFSEMHPVIDGQPIENASPWICFYNKDKGFAFGSIRIVYDNTDIYGNESILYQPHTQIGEWLKGVRYWNRRLIHDHLTYVPAGSMYREENAYLVFKTTEGNPLQDIQYWADRLRNPLNLKLEYPKKWSEK